MLKKYDAMCVFFENCFLKKKSGRETQSESEEFLCFLPLFCLFSGTKENVRGTRGERSLFVSVKRVPHHLIFFSPFSHVWYAVCRRRRHFFFPINARDTQKSSREIESTRETRIKLYNTLNRALTTTTRRRRRTTAKNTTLPTCARSEIVTRNPLHI